MHSTIQAPENCWLRESCWQFRHVRFTRLDSKHVNLYIPYDTPGALMCLGRSPPELLAVSICQLNLFDTSAEDGEDNRLAQLVLPLCEAGMRMQVQTEGNANSPGRERIKQLVQECFCLSAASAMVNPTGSLVFYSLKMDAQSPDGAAEKPNPEYWAHIAVGL